MREVYGYLANQFGFSETGLYLLDHLIKPRIEKIGIIINDPFIECGKELDPENLLQLKSHNAVKKYWERFSKKVTPINNRLMQNSHCMLALLDGGHAIDDGVASEIGYYTALGKGPIFALRSDFRGGENIATLINPQVLGYISQSKGQLIDGTNAIERWFEAVKLWYDSFKENP